MKSFAAGVVAAATGAAVLDSADAAKCIQVGKSCKKQKGKPKPKCCNGARCKNNSCKCTGNKKQCGNDCIKKSQCCKNSDCPGNQTCNNKHKCVGGGTNGKCSGNGQCGANGACSCTQAGRPTIPGSGKCQANAFTQNFTSNANGWFAFLNPDDNTQKTWSPPETGGTITLDGGSALIAPVNDNTSEFTAATAWGGFSTRFPNGGFTTEVDVFLDPATVVDQPPTKFVYSVAINGSNSDCAYNSEYWIHGGGSQNELDVFCVRVGGPFNAGPCNGGAASAPIVEAGFYTFRHVFREVGGQLSVTMTVLDAGGDTVVSDTMNGGPIAEIGGNRYGWFPHQDFAPLRIDNSRRING